ncbi:MAG TPA: DUF2219 domain-containing protein, partial [Caulobacter sp.]|nr:DUF2219 domain-containing protein [Caulobacter sp.]
MRVAGERTVFSLIAACAAMASLYGTAACAASKAGKLAKAASGGVSTPGNPAPADKVSFQVKPETLRPLDPASATGIVSYDVDAIELALEGGFALSPAGVASGDARILDADRYYDGAGPVSWRTNAFTHQARAGGPIDSVRVSVAGLARTAAVAPLTLV